MPASLLESLITVSGPMAALIYVLYTNSVQNTKAIERLSDRIDSLLMVWKENGHERG